MKAMKRSTLFIPLTLIAILFLSVSCQKDEVPDPAETIDALIKSAGVPEEPVAKTDSTVLERDFDFANNWICESIEVDATQVRGDYRTFDPNSEIIWPGNLLQGASITKATPDPIVVERAGGTFTINLINGSDSETTQASVDKVNQSNVVSALNEIIAANSGAIPANFTYHMEEVESREQLALAMGVNVSTLTTDVNTKLSFASDKVYNRFMVDFTQIYYTMIYEKPTSYDQVFAPTVSSKELEPYMSDNNPPVYISSVTYGRRFYLLIESTSGVETMKASIKASYDAAVGSADFDSKATYVTDLDESNIKIFAMGGDANSALGAFNGDLNGLKAYLQDGSDYFKAAPLSYVMTSLAPPQKQVGIGVYSKFTIQNCKPAYAVSPPQFIKEWYSVFGDEGIGAACAIDPGQNNAYLFSKDGTRYAVSQNGVINGIYNLSDAGHPLAGCPFDSIGSAVTYYSKNLYVLDKSGLHFCGMSPGGSWSEIHELREWGAIADSHPFRPDAVTSGEPGVGAVLNYTTSSRVNRAIHFDRAGQHWVIHNVADGTWGSVNALTTWGSSIGPEWNIPFLGEGVGVALQVYAENFLPDPRTGVLAPGKSYYQVLFNHSGTKLSVYHSNTGFSPVYDMVPPEE